MKQPKGNHDNTAKDVLLSNALVHPSHEHTCDVDLGGAAVMTGYGCPLVPVGGRRPGGSDERECKS